MQNDTGDKDMTKTTPSPDTLTVALENAVKRRGAATFVRHGNRTTSYQAFQERSARLAIGLQCMGLRRGDRIGLLALNQIEWMELFFAATRIGAVVVGMSVRYRANELVYMVNDSQIKAIALIPESDGHDFIAMFDGLAPEMPSLQRLIVLDAPEADELRSVSIASRAAIPAVPYASLFEDSDAAASNGFTPLQPADLAMVIYTSGTTGKPKGAGLSHLNLLAAARAQAEHMRMTETDHLPLALPLNHVGGITCGVLSILVTGGTLDLIAEFRAELVLQRMRLHRPTLLSGVPTMMTLLLLKSTSDSDFETLRLVFFGGSNVEPTLLLQLQRRMPGAMLMNLYGMSETSGAIIMSPWGAEEHSLLTEIGKPIGDAQVKVVKPGNDDVLAAGQIGELCYRGAGVVAGYVGAAANVASAFTSDGWLRSGDLGEMSSAGSIRLHGRAKDMFIRGGFNVYPAEVENFLARHPGVLMVAGIGVADPVLGEVGHYFVVGADGSHIDEDTLIQFCKEGLANYKVPHRIHLRASLPMTPAGKIHKALLRQEKL